MGFVQARHQMNNIKHKHVGSSLQHHRKCVCHFGADVTLQLCAKQTAGCPEYSISLFVRVLSRGEKRCEDIKRLKAVNKSTSLVIHTIIIILSKSASHKSLASSAGFGRQLFVGIDLTLRAASPGRPLTQPALLLRPLVHIQLAHAHLDTRVTCHVSAPGVRLLLISPIAGQSFRCFCSGLQDHSGFCLVDRWLAF